MIGNRSRRWFFCLLAVTMAAFVVTGCPARDDEPTFIDRIQVSLTGQNTVLRLKRYIYEGNHVLVESVERLPLEGLLVFRIDDSVATVELIKMTYADTGRFTGLSLRLGTQAEIPISLKEPAVDFADIIFNGSGSYDNQIVPFPAKLARDLEFALSYDAQRSRFSLRVTPADWVPLFEAANESLSFVDLEISNLSF